MGASSSENGSRRERRLPTAEQRRRLGKGGRAQAPRRSHAEWSPAPDRRDPVEVIREQDRDRLDFLVPIRHQRMGASPFAFYRATAALMASDLAGTPVSGLQAQLCGDAHLSNFGLFASPERNLIFDVNDFDETLRGPWEWDIKRLAASLVLAGRDLGLSPKRTRGVASEAVSRYREKMRELAGRRNLDIWYERLDVDQVDPLLEPSDRKRLDRGRRKARRRNNLRSFKKLAEVVDGRPRLRSDPPLLIPLREIPPSLDPPDEAEVRRVYESYRRTVPSELGALLDRYEIADVALKVVGVGSVGTRCSVVLLIGRDLDDPLFLQVKEAGASALESELGPDRGRSPGRRVVEGQRLMQSFGDIFLGWSDESREGRHHYWRQLKDMKGSAEIESMDRASLQRYAGICGWTLARAHARSGDPVAIAGYLGKSDRFDSAIARFGERYADQAEADFDAFSSAFRAGRISTDAPEQSPVQA